MLNPGITARICMLATMACLALAAPAPAVVLPAGFQQSTVIRNLVNPTDVEVAVNGRVFVAEKSGIVKTYTSLSDTSATVTADLRTQVHNYSNRGLLGLAIDPAFPANPYVYVYYTLDAPQGGTPPVFGAPGQDADTCPGDLDVVNCVVSARVSRLRVAGEQMDGPEQVLVNDWCQQFQYHPGGGLEFGADGYLYVSGGDGGRWGTWDYGQLGNPANACGDPPTGAVGALMTPPTAEGGRLRSQDLRTGSDPLGLAGSLIRIDPATGAGAPGNPRATSADPNERRMLAHGLRNAARLAMRPGTNDAWVADWGGGYWEEINRVPRRAIRSGTSAGPVTRAASTRTASLMRACARAATTSSSRSARASTRRPPRQRPPTGPTTTSSRSFRGRTAPSTTARTSRGARSGACPSIPPAATSRRPTVGRCSSGRAARVHLGDASRRRRAAGARPRRRLRRGRCQPARHRAGARPASCCGSTRTRPT